MMSFLRWVSIRQRPVWISVCLLFALGVSADSVTKTWELAAGDRSYLTTADLERGLAYNPATGNLLLASAFGSPQVYILNGANGLDGDTGNGPLTLRLTATDSSGNETNVLSGGTILLNLVGVAGDGVVYAANLRVSASDNFSIYRWSSDNVTNSPTLAYSGDPSAGLVASGDDIRYGDSFAVRGSGTNTQFIATSRSGKYLAVFSSTDGINFTSQTLVANVSGAGLSVAFGDGNTFWAGGASLRRLQYDLAKATVTNLNSYDSTAIPGSPSGLAYDPAGQALAVVDASGNTFAVYDVSDPANPARVADFLHFLSENPNTNGTAAAAISGSLAFGLDTNNGMMAVAIQRAAPQPVILSTPNYSNGTIEFSMTGQPGTYRIQETAALAPANWVDIGNYTIPAPPLIFIMEFTTPATNAAGFFRAVSP